MTMTNDMAKPMYWAQRVQTQFNAGGRSLDALRDEFACAMDAAVDEHVRNQREKAAYIDAHEGASESPEAGDMRDASSDYSSGPEDKPKDERRSAQSLLVHFNDGTERVMHMHHPIIQQGGWHPSVINGVPFLVLGHGIPRQMIPLCNVKSIDLTDELL
jgi:hypothetical protein